MTTDVPPGVPVCEHGLMVDRGGLGQLYGCPEWVCPPEARTVVPTARAVKEAAAVPVWEWQSAFRDCTDDRLSASAKCVGFVLATYADTKTGADIFPLQQTVARACGLGRQAVNGHMSGSSYLRWV